MGALNDGTREADAPPLTGRRVVALSTGIAGGYCSRLLTLGGADVVTVEAPTGDPLRRWSASGASIPDDADAPLFTHLHASTRSVVVDPAAADAGDRIDALLAAADLVLWSPGSPLTDGPDAPAASVADLHARHPGLVVVAVTPFGLDTPWTGRAATEFTLQGWCGGLIRLGRGHPDHPPAHVGGQVGEWLAGTVAAIGALAALRRRDRATDGLGEVVDVSVLEALATGLTYQPVTFHDVLDRPLREDRFVPTPGVAQAQDGLVGLGVGTGQQWLDFCAMVGHPEWMEERSYFFDRTALAPEIDAWVAEHAVDEILDLASAFRLPNAPVANGADVVEIEHLRARGAFVLDPRSGVTNPAPPFRFDAVRLRDREPAPRLGEHTAAVDWPPRPAGPPIVTTSDGAGGPDEAVPLPFAGLRVLDMTAFWAGPVTGHLLGLLGADVIHLESPKRPDGARLVGDIPRRVDRHLERGPVFAGLNTNKSGLAVDLGDPRGVEAVKRVVATCDVVVENFTPRVLDQLGLDHDTLRGVRDDLIVVRMPGFGLDGPWRDVAAFAFVIEDATGLTWLTGHPDVPPIEPYSIGDPNAGLHALVGLQLALAHRDRTGEGGLVEAAMVDAALNIAAEQVIEHSAHGALLQRAGNRGPCAAPQNTYRVVGPDEFGRDDCWVAIAVADDEQWQALRHALGDPAWAADPALETEAGRRREHDRIDRELQAWCADRTADEVVAVLWPAGVPVAPVRHPHRQADLDPMLVRGFFEELDHPVTGRARYATAPMRFSRGPARRLHRPAPLLGQHTHEILRAVGIADDELAALEADGVIAPAVDVPVR